MWLYYVTDRKQFPGGPAEQRRRVLDKIAEATSCGVDFIQLREKDLSPRELEKLSRDAVAAIREAPVPTPRASHSAHHRSKLLINSRVDIAIAVGADGVHLPADDLSPAEARAIWDKAVGHRGPAVIGVSCHSAADVRRAHGDGADFAVFAPVFEKVTASGKQTGSGLEALRVACESATSHSPTARKAFPVFALGGLTLDNAQSCFEAGAPGIAGIRLFQDHDVKTVVARLIGRS